MMKKTSDILSIEGFEPNVQDLNPSYFKVGGQFGTRPVIKSIIHRVENRGDHGVGWYDVIGEDDRVMTSMNERAVATIMYKQEEEEKS